MKKIISLFFLFFIYQSVVSQDIEVKYDKSRDFSIYKTFSVSEGEIFTAKDARQFDEQQLKSWIRDAIIRELTLKGLQLVDSAGHLRVDFVAGTLQQSSMEDLGPMGYSQSADPTGIGSSRTWSNRQSQGSLFLDIRDTQSNQIVWSSTSTLNLIEGNDAQKLIGEVTMKTLKKLSTKPKKKKK